MASPLLPDTQNTRPAKTKTKSTPATAIAGVGGSGNSTPELRCGFQHQREEDEARLNDHRGRIGCCNHIERAGVVHRPRRRVDRDSSDRGGRGKEGRRARGQRVGEGGRFHLPKFCPVV